MNLYFIVIFVWGWKLIHFTCLLKMSIILEKGMDTSIKMLSCYIFITFKNACRGEQPWTLEVLRSARKITLQSLCCRESSVTISCSSFSIIDDTTRKRGVYHKLESWVRHYFLTPQFCILQYEKMSVWSYLSPCLPFYYLPQYYWNNHNGQWALHNTCLRVNHIIHATDRKEDSRSTRPAPARIPNGHYSVLRFLILLESKSAFLNLPT